MRGVSCVRPFTAQWTPAAAQQLKIQTMSAQSSISSVKIEAVEVSAFTFPTDFPESDGTLAWDKTTVVVSEVLGGGIRGLGYTYADVATACLIKDFLAGIVRGRDAMDVEGSWVAMVRAVRNLGRAGIASMAIAAVDSALWDLKGRLLELPLVKLLGMVRDRAPVYGSGGFTSYSIRKLQEQLRRIGIDAAPAEARGVVL